jgi:EAL domain-containing protein (putative c-di-GMP-specific phosphodiesterase class I)
MSTNIKELISQENLVSHYQPIVSVKKKRNVGAEALARASDARTGLPVPPLQLFEWADQESQTLELDRLCRKKAMQGFASLLKLDPELLLFINFEVSVLDDGVLGSGNMLALTQDMGLKPENIVIEINESKVEKVLALQDFVERHKGLGFLIALDDLGTGHSNLQRLALLKPDILKLDRSLIQGLGGDFFKREIFKSLVSLAHNIGALVLAEGVETENEVSTSLGLGADLFQGFYFSRPMDVADWRPSGVKDIIERCAARNKDSIVRDMLRRRDESIKHRGLLMEIVGKLSGAVPEVFDRVLSGTVLKARELECLFVLDAQGSQVTRTVTMQYMRGRTRGPLFQPALPGTDHSMKDYYYGLMDAGLARFITEPYVSLASGNLCRTLSCSFKGAEEKNYVLCMDVRAD